MFEGISGLLVIGAIVFSIFAIIIFFLLHKLFKSVSHNFDGNYGADADDQTKKKGQKSPFLLY